MVYPNIVGGDTHSILYGVNNLLASRMNDPVIDVSHFDSNGFRRFQLGFGRLLPEHMGHPDQG